MREKIRGHRVCLGDIVLNIARMLSLWRGLPKLAKSEQISNFLIYLTNSQFNCIIFVKEQLNFSKLIIHAQKSFALQNRGTTLIHLFFYASFYCSR